MYLKLKWMRKRTEINPYMKQTNQQFVPVYNRDPIVWDHSEGMYLYDIERKRYLDFGSGIGECALGYHDSNYTRTDGEAAAHILFFIWSYGGFNWHHRSSERCITCRRSWYNLRFQSSGNSKPLLLYSSFTNSMTY